MKQEGKGIQIQTISTILFCVVLSILSYFLMYLLIMYLPFQQKQFPLNMLTLPYHLKIGQDIATNCKFSHRKLRTHCPEALRYVKVWGRDVVRSLTLAYAKKPSVLQLERD